ncbi:hypothetical protein BT69DRAFT_1316176 [Atractiella rhizophila]|nr:hypothetical protein BT69DRAFT_1316176 [Atractiella rhizophila]
MSTPLKVSEKTPVFSRTVRTSDSASLEKSHPVKAPVTIAKTPESQPAEIADLINGMIRLGVKDQNEIAVTQIKPESLERTRFCYRCKGTNICFGGALSSNDKGNAGRPYSRCEHCLWDRTPDGSKNFLYFEDYEGLLPFRCNCTDYPLGGGWRASPALQKDIATDSYKNRRFNLRNRPFSVPRDKAVKMAICPRDSYADNRCDFLAVFVDGDWYKLF